MVLKTLLLYIQRKHFLLLETYKYMIYNGCHVFYGC